MMMYNQIIDRLSINLHMTHTTARAVPAANPVFNADAIFQENTSSLFSAWIAENRNKNEN